MKKITKLITFTSLCIFALASCQTTEKTNKKQSPDIEIAQENQAGGKIIKEPKPITVQNTSNQKEMEFKKLLEDLTLTVVSSPNPKRSVFTESAFSSPYIIQATNSEGPVTDLNITVSYPISRQDDVISYATVQVKTNEEGKITFLPGTPSIAVNDFITFYPTPVSSASNIVQLAYNTGINAPYVVKSKYINYPGGILFIYDFNEKNQPTINNLSLLQYFRKIGINAGNAPISESSYLDKPVSEIYKACLDITMGEIKKAANFMAIGTFKFNNPITEEDGKYICTITAEITCISMKDGNTIFTKTLTETTSDTDRKTSELNCKNILAEKIANSIIYGM